MRRRSDGRNKGLKQSEKTALKSKIRTMIGENYWDDEIMLALNLQPHVYWFYRKKVGTEMLKEFLEGGSNGIFQRYVQFGQQTLKALEEVMTEAPKTKRNASAAVQAAKITNDIHNSIVKLACELGLVPKHTKTISFDGQVFAKT